MRKQNIRAPLPTKPKGLTIDGFIIASIMFGGLFLLLLHGFSMYN